MRVLFTTPGGLGHIHPTVPLAQAMVARGHELVWAVPARSAEHVERAGFRAAATSDAPPAGPREVIAAYPELLDHPVAERPDFMFGKLFGAIAAPAMLKGLAPLALEWRPELVVADAAELAAPIVAAELGVPCATKGFGPLLPEVRYARGAEEVAPLWRSRGLEPRPYCGMFDHLYLDIYPSGLPTTAGWRVGRRQLLRPIAYDGRPDGSVPLPTGRADSPLVYVTMGTVFNDAGPLRAAVDAIASLDARVLVTVGPVAEPDVIGAQPDHVRVEQYVPQTALLPRCDVVVSHAGSGTVLATLANGLPQLCLPQGADQFLNASAVAAAGAGISLPPDAATADTIADAVGRLLAEPAYGVAAKEVAASIEAMPSPDEVAAVLEDLA
jgi:UDP:flavonoid glycosyltransferase YjiC (YdhE family)